MTLETGVNDETTFDRAHVFHPSMNIAASDAGETSIRVMTKSKDLILTDRDGKEYIDGFAGLWCVNVGYGRTEIADAVHEQINKMNYVHTYDGSSHRPMIELSTRIAKMAGMGMNHVFFGMSGSDANETNVKIVWYVNNILGRPEKKKIIARQRAYHGSGLMTGSLTGQPGFHVLFDLPLPQVRHVSAAHYWKDGLPGESETDYSQRLADELEQMILSEGPETVAAFIAEPVVGSGGILPPPAGYWEAIQKILKKYDVMLIADEVVTGFGRTGMAFGSQLYGIQPDLMAVAKGISSGYLPLSGVLVHDRIWEILREGTKEHGNFIHGWTYSGHPVCIAAANTTLDIIEREGLIENARTTGAYLQEAMHAAFDGHPNLGEVRGVGLLSAVEFVQDRDPRSYFSPDLKVAARIREEALQSGLIARALGESDSLGLAPPLTVTRSDVDQIVGILSDAAKRTLAQV